MAVEVISKGENRAQFLITDTHFSVVNALRRAIITGVKTIAIDDVIIYNNTSTMYDEILAHRLGLIPIKTIPELERSKKEVVFTLKEIGPKIVHSGDLKSSDPDIVPVYDDMVIVPLKLGESIDLEAKTKFGDGNEHTKFTPAHVFYHFYPKIDITKENVKNASQIAEKCPVNILEAEDGKLSVKKGQLSRCILCGACEDFAGKDIIRVSSDNKKIVFEIESWGQLSLKQIVDEALDLLMEEAEAVKESIIK
ncbi:MAG: DNA-directed RNA polymerase subunit D [Candidatus Parvarchaeota archaeon]|nr:DNA-directed RNA polymerase subunit D [Candidatus Parvarchaeota archaeon]MCW1301604.1 DNA-directed RNA polymerase subunit D [Candidatus Parvarchaeota archaeon]